MTRQQPRGLLSQELPELWHGGVGLLGQIELREAAVRVDREQRRGVIYLPLLDRYLDLLRLPDTLQLSQRPDQEVPPADHPVHLGVGAHVGDRGRGRVGVYSQQLHP